MLKVYVACPYTKGDVAVNVKTSMSAANELYDMGVNPFNPLLSHFSHMAHPRDYNFWMTIDYDWIDVCDVLLRLPGVSDGADMEVAYAEKKGKKIFYSIIDLEYYVKQTK